MAVWTCLAGEPVWQELYIRGMIRLKMPVSYTHLDVYKRQDHTDGLLKGCDIRAEDGRLVIGKGMLKFHDFIYLMMEEELSLIHI